MNISTIDSMINKVYELIGQGKVKEADDLLVEVLGLDENNAEAWMVKGILKVETGNIDEVTECLERALSLEPDYAEAHLTYGQYLYTQGQIESALHHFKAAVLSEPDFVEAWLALSAVNGRLGYFHDAETASLRVLELEPGSREAKINLVNAWISQAIMYFQ